jgi:hypothetical protein
MRWEKQGLIFRTDGQHPWMMSHATSPFALSIGGSRYRIYFSSRDERNRSHLAFVEIDMREPTRVLRICDRPALAPGPLGFFDDHGVFARGLVPVGDKLYLYYLGWNPGLEPPMFYCSIGLAISTDGGETFERVSAAPIIERSPVDPWCVLLPFVLREADCWRMWYASGIGWREGGGGARHSIYDVKYAESRDGLNWYREGRVMIGLKPDETNVAHPCVVRDGDGYSMWYSYNCGAGYRIGWATSLDGLTWVRRDAEAGIEVSPSGWDSSMVCHPYVFNHEGDRFMLYAGNNYGRDGLGLARALD